MASKHLSKLQQFHRRHQPPSFSAGFPNTLRSNHRTRTTTTARSLSHYRNRQVASSCLYSSRLVPDRQQEQQQQWGKVSLRSSVSEAVGTVATDFEDDNEHETSSIEIKNALEKTFEDEDKDDAKRSQLPSYIRWTVPDPSDPPVYESSEYVLQSLTSQPKEEGGGNWNQRHPLEWAKQFGRRTVKRAAELAPLIKLRPGDQGFFNVDDSDSPYAIVRTKEEARKVLQRLYNADPSIYHGCDTEVMEIDLSKVGPVGNGYVTCVSIYSGPDFDYGLGHGPGTCLWIDNLDDACGVLQEFKDWFEDDRFRKVWHNYGFDRHVMWNEGIDCKGFAGDTMHMARLENSARLKFGNGYSLEAISEVLLDKKKEPMKNLFGVPRLLKDGRPGSMVDVPPIEVLQRDPRHRSKFIHYSCYDAQCTWEIREKLEGLLDNMPWLNGESLWSYYQRYLCAFGEVLTDMERRGIRVDAGDYLAGVEEQARKDLKDQEEKFRQWAYEQIGIDGLALNPSSSTQLSTFLFGGAPNEKTQEPTETERIFSVSREDVPEEALKAYAIRDAEDTEPQTSEIEVMTAIQLKEWCDKFHLKKTGKKSELQERILDYCQSKSSRQEEFDPTDDFDSMDKASLKSCCIARGLSDKGSEDALRHRLKADADYARKLRETVPSDNVSGLDMISNALSRAAEGDANLEEILQEVRQKANALPKKIDVKITSIGLPPIKYTAGGAPSVTAAVIQKLAGDPYGDHPRFGTAYEFFGGAERGQKACEALHALATIGSIETMLGNFLQNLRSLSDDDSRVHCSLNFNTETGRLSARTPNLQNQPALEKDKYKIRKAFQASPGNRLIVADYGQLELRLLASMTECKSMISAFKSGGDFHSRTALDMFDYVKKSVDDGECLLEWDYAEGDPPKPLLKDKYASERRKAKTLNFSIAYGKTSYGLSQDWGVSKQEAQSMLDAWYNARPEVDKWQKKTKKFAQERGYTRTLMGRYRNIPEARSDDKKLQGHGMRASINTPIQGGAADVAMMAMIKINESEKLKSLGWILLLQIHDEVILEGPEETAEEAFAEVTYMMENPWVFGLPETAVPLLVDGSYTNTNWYDAK